MEPTLPAVHALHMAELLERWDVPAARLYAGLDLPERVLSEPDGRIPLSTVEKLVERARALSGEPALGLHLGLQMRISAHGDLGFAAMTAPTVREALDVAVRFTPLRTTALGLRLHEQNDVAALVVEERASFGTARDVVLLSLIVGIWQIGNALTGRELRGDVDLAIEEPDYMRRFAGFAPGTIRFGRPNNQIVFERSVLDLPLIMADRASQRVAREQCERALEALGREGELLTRVRVLIPREDGGVRTLPEVAARVHMSERTLKRRLTDHGTTFSRLVDEHRRDAAMLLLRSPDLSIEEIADRTGYSDAANFTRAFRRWTGVSPRAFRRSALGVAPEDHPAGR
ncbi:MAG: AraC family transcriptional regulator [Myxococcota bacterium]